jgi:2-haloalkanoic acid dehalogenase type II
MQELQAICLDLDDTLWDLSQVIPRAERALYDWYDENYPQVTQNYSAEDILQMRLQVGAANPHLAHDLTELRMTVLRNIARNSGYTEAMAAEAFAVFQHVRNSVDLYDDVIPGLMQLGERYKLYALSNGNADLEVVGIASYFERAFSARELGVAKPDVRVFKAVCSHTDLAASQIVHVGDHPANDIVAASHAGMRTVWINRDERDWEIKDCDPDYEVRCLLELASILCP